MRTKVYIRKPFPKEISITISECIAYLDWPYYGPTRDDLQGSGQATLQQHRVERKQ
jgi:hypothetical protein